MWIAGSIGTHPHVVFTCYLGVPPLAESFCSDGVSSHSRSSAVVGSGADPLKCPQSPGPSLPCLEGGREIKVERKKKRVRCEIFKSKTEWGFLSFFSLNNIAD